MATPAQIATIPLLAYAAWRIARYIFLRRTLSMLPGPQRTSWLLGNFKELFSKDCWNYHRELYKNFGGAVKVNALFGTEQLYVTDPLALHHIFVKDQYNYIFPPATGLTLSLTFGTNVFSSLGEEHRRARKLLNPAFSPKHICGLIGVFHSISRKLCERIHSEVRNGKEHIDMLFWSSRAAVEYIGQGGMGYGFNSLNADVENPYCDILERYMPAFADTTIIRLLFLPWVLKIGTPAFRKWVIERVPIRGIQTMIMTSKISDETCLKILQSRRDALAKGDAVTEEQVGQGKDIISVLLRESMNAGLSDTDLLGQISLFMFAGHGSTTTAMARALHVLAHRPEAQERLRTEAITALETYGLEMEYDTLMSLPYLDAVCRETFRVHPPVMAVQRTVETDIVLPLRDPVTTKDGSKIWEIPLEKGTEILVSVYNANMSKAIWGEDAEEWKPERWLKPLPSSVADAHLPGVYSNMMTFIGGSKACIGFKLAEMELKLVLATLVVKFRFAPGPEIAWEQNTLQTPVVANSGDRKPQLPLKVTLVQN